MFSDQNLSLTDCLSVTLIRREGIENGFWLRSSFRTGRIRAVAPEHEFQLEASQLVGLEQ